MSEGMCVHCGYFLVGGTCDNGCDQSMPVVAKPPTEIEIAEVISDLSGTQQQNVVRRLAFERDRLKSAIDGKGGWKDESEKQKQSIAELEGELEKQKTEALGDIRRVGEWKQKALELEAENKVLEDEVEEWKRKAECTPEGFLDLEAEAERLTADNAVLLERLRETCLEGEGPSFCIWCGFPKMSGHAENCLLEQDHPGAALLERLREYEQNAPKIDEMVELFSCYAIDFMSDDQVEELDDGWFDKFHNQCKIPLRPLYARLAALERVAEAYRNHEGHECESPRCGHGEVCQDCQEVIEALAELDKTK